jgi:hypothetical protein
MRSLLLYLLLIAPAVAQPVFILDAPTPVESVSPPPSPPGTGVGGWEASRMTPEPVSPQPAISLFPQRPNDGEAVWVQGQLYRWNASDERWQSLR